MPANLPAADANPEAVRTRTIRLLRKNRNFADAFYLGRRQLERGATSEEMLRGLIRDACEAGLLDECGEFLVRLAGEHPNDATLLNFTAGLLGEMGRKQESRALAKAVAARRPFFPAEVKNAKLHVLSLQCIATVDYKYSPLGGRFYLPGLTNLPTLLDPRIAVHRLLVDDLPAALAVVESLPKCDVVFNTISDPDYEEPLRNAAKLCEALGLPVFNPPRRVRAMNRVSLPTAACEKSDGIMAARSLFLPPGGTDNRDIALAMHENHFQFPVIIRAPGFQGGRHMQRIRHTVDELKDDLYRGDGLYVIEFVDVSFRDQRAGSCVLYPKYRAFFASGQLFPIHLFVSDQYEVHKKTSAPLRARHPWLAEMEEEFVRDPARHLPEGLWKALKTAAAGFGLDYFGMDFAVSKRPGDGGKLVLFECNAAMSNRLVLLPEGGPVQRQWHDVTLAAHIGLCARGGAPEWPFAIKKGLPVPPEK